jgi:hypothetical protein
MTALPPDPAAALAHVRDLLADAHEHLESLLPHLPARVARRLRPACRKVDSLLGTELDSYTLDDALRELAATPNPANLVSLSATG